MKRYLEFEGIDEKRGGITSAKFWEVTVDGSELVVRFGKIGTNGQQTLKSMGSPEEATAEATKLANSKIKKGYVEKPVTSSD